MTSKVLDLACELIRLPSVTPDDAGCQDLLAERLAAAGLEIVHLPSGPVSNLIATHGRGRPHLMLLGHTDVVPPGAQAQWHSPPFEPAIRDGRLFGRGAADMKSSVAAFVVALELFVDLHPDHSGMVSLVLTSDEEGTAEHGVRTVVPRLQAESRLPDFVLVGEPSSAEQLGDNIRVGRRGSIQARLTVHGAQGHTAYADPADNPVHRTAALLSALSGLGFDDGDEYFPATTLQISNLRAGSGADNVTPGELEIWFNLRHHPGQSAEALEGRVRQLIQANDPGPWYLDWRISGAPFGPTRGPLVEAASGACRAQLSINPNLTTGGGTSDGRFFGPLGIPVVELGPVNRTIHRANECIAVADLEQLPGLYLAVMERLLTESGG